jgi:hypothetical protein
LAALEAGLAAGLVQTLWQAIWLRNIARKYNFSLVKAIANPNTPQALFAHTISVCHCTVLSSSTPLEKPLSADVNKTHQNLCHALRQPGFCRVLWWVTGKLRNWHHVDCMVGCGCADRKSVWHHSLASLEKTLVVKTAEDLKHLRALWAADACFLLV